MINADYELINADLNRNYMLDLIINKKIILNIKDPRKSVLKSAKILK